MTISPGTERSIQELPRLIGKLNLTMERLESALNAQPLRYFSEPVPERPIPDSSEVGMRVSRDGWIKIPRNMVWDWQEGRLDDKQFYQLLCKAPDVYKLPGDEKMVENVFKACEDIMAYLREGVIDLPPRLKALLVKLKEAMGQNIMEG